MPKGPQGQKRLYGYSVALMGVLWVLHRVFGDRLQAWYATMPHIEAAAIGGGIIMAILALLSVGVLFLRNDGDA